MVNFFITRPIFASVVALVMVLAGIVGYELLPVAQFPEIAPPQVVVTTSYAGASAQTVADTVTTPPTIFGEKRYAMRVWLNPDRLAALGVTAAQVQAAITEQNQQVAGGKLGEAPSPPGQRVITGHCRR